MFSYNSGGSKCVTGWTEFYNIDNPDFNPAGDDDESLFRIREISILRRWSAEEGRVQNPRRWSARRLFCCEHIWNEMLAQGRFHLLQGQCARMSDFMVRFYCLCEPTEPTTLRIIETTPTPIPIVPVPFECGWTPWLNTDTPDVGEQDDGDLEDLSTIQYLYKTCGGADLKDIECRMSRTHHSYDLSQQNNLQCNLQDGFSCHNKDQIGKCYDYEIRLLCMYDWCYPATTTPVPTTTVTTVNPCPDGEVYDECAYRCDQMCSSFTHQMTSRCVSFTNCVPACRPIAGCQPPNVWRDYYTCVPKEECTCIFFLEGDQERIVAPNEVFIKDCERCQCVHDQLNCVIDPTLCGPPPTGKTRLIIPKENITREDCWTEWVSIDSPDNGVGDLEKINTYWEKFEFYKQKASEVGQYITCDLQTGLICWNKDNQPEGCYDYEVRYFCPCAATTLAPTTLPTTTVTTPPTLQPGICVFGWTEWFNSHHPDNRGDYESIQSSRFNHIFCSSDMITSIECRRAGTDGIGLLQRGVYCDLQAGLICSQDYLGEQESCWDYEVRFFCDCPTTEPFTEPETLPPIVTELPSLVPCAYWSDWINEHHPPEKGKGTKTGVKGKGAKVGGDTEKAMPLKLRREYDFCNDGIVTDIECRDAETDLDHKETGDRKTVCDMTSGFRCRGYDQPGKFCRDYKIRYYCSCKPTPAVIITKPSTPTIHIEPCTVYYNVIDGPKPLPDSHIKASTSKDSMSGPQSSRLSSISSTRSAGAWIAGEIDDRQFIEVDLGFIQNVYGVVTLGRHGHPEWVKSYKVLYSNDGLTFRYVGEDGIKEKIFGGNFDSITPIEHIFKNPFEARFVRIQPIDFHKEIALRFDIYGCAEGMTTVPTTITLPPTCTDEMGLYNGSIVDKQVKVSSSKLENTDERYIRLFTPGAWVAGELDENQFVEVDFEGPRELSGVQIQGRHNVSQWVTAFTVSYSQDGTIWNYITDSSGTAKKVNYKIASIHFSINFRCFSGNYDSDTVVTVYFPQPIRARFVHINPVGWRNWISMRLEILGCYEAKEAVLSENGTSVPLEMLEGNCSQQMGFENHQLPDSAIWVSSSESPRSDASRIRLNTHADEEGTGGWIAATYDYKPVIFIDFFGPRNLTGIETQGVEDVDKWVKTYYVKYSLDNVTWEDAYAKETGYFGFDGNVDRDRPKLSVFSTMILARYLKVILVDYHGGPGLRMEVQGCFLPYEEIVPPPATITPTEFCAEWGDWLSLSDPASNPYGDEENINDIIAHTGKCYNPYEIQCRDMVTQQDYSKVRQSVSCDLQNGLLCLNNDQSSGLCHNYEVRIKCWTCGVETTTPSLPLILCPEDLVVYLTLTVPVLWMEKKFKPSNLILTKDCQECDCLLGGHTSCRPKVCEPCSETQKAELDENCECRCVGCEEGTVLCPSTQECIPESRWCDGVRDCQDDEIDCPTTPRITTVTTPPTTTTEVPIICTTDFVDVTDTCEMISNNFETFDGLSYQYDICDHVLMQEKTSNLYSVSVHKTCSPENINACERYLHIEVDGVTLKIGPGMDDVTVQDNRVSVANLWIVSKRFQNFDIKKKGSSIVFKSKKYHFDVIWDNVQNAKIVGEFADLTLTLESKKRI
ncbi:EGF-like repeat and discoidin I-like domain-containing protein 3 [Caerostris extrusa]|uniref:EGF-like repeat and discoidin I-like domain-containing protein 3 n=1 Tax=Caerostris extrusa TaxID=172846 RepID=A0AAV4VZC5_CAEEX|nr:EGF-like repeat and discoidin I-like domain-containing protein 3 [Caerostris extrusa]